MQHVHFIGIGGIGMSGLARLYLHEGAKVTGSDNAASENTKKLEAEGATVYYVQGPENITHEIDLVVYTEAMPADHPELAAARAAGIETINYFTALGRVANEYYLIAVAGTHGKTTTTAMLIDILEEAYFDPTAIVGSLRQKTGSNFRAGRSKYFVVEACEYRRDFLSLYPQVLIITNLEYEHVDYYHSLEDVQQAFKELAARVPEDGAVVLDRRDPNVAPVAAATRARLVDYREYIDMQHTLPTPGLHNRLNAAAAAAAAAVLGVSAAITRDALDHFAGTARRFEYQGEVNGAPVYDEYAHHPTEIEAAVAAARERYPDKKITVIFQPHTHSRTDALFHEFAAALARADRVMLVPIYEARAEAAPGRESSETLAEAVVQKGGAATYFYTPNAAALTVRESVGSDDVVLVMGAGNVNEMVRDLT